MGGTGHIELDDLKDKLSAERNGVVLNRKVVALLAEFAVSTLEVVDDKELLDLGPDGLEAALGEAWDSENVPRAFVASLQEWAAPLRGKAPTVKSAKVRAPRRKVEEGPLTDGSDGEESVMGDASSVKANKDLLSDMKTYGMDRPEITALDFSMHAGSIVAQADIEDVPYGKDVSNTAYSRHLKKLDFVLLPALLAKGDATGVREHFLGLTRQYNDEGMTKEVTIIHNFMTTTEELFAGDDAGFCSYIAAVRRRWKGRAFPKAYDPMLVLKTMKSQSGGAKLSSELATVKEDLRKEKASSAELKTKVNGLQSTLSRLETRVGRVESSGGNATRLKGAGPPDNPGGKKCGICGSSKHFKRDCPDNPDNKAEDTNEEDKE